MSRTVVIDTNVVVSGLLSGDPKAPTSTILNQMLAGRLSYLLSVELVAEYREVLLRERVRVRHGLDRREVDTLLTHIVANGIVRDTSATSGAPDPGDNHLWALLATSEKPWLVTGDARLLDHPPAGASILSPRSFIRLQS